MYYLGMDIFIKIIKYYIEVCNIKFKRAVVFGKDKKKYD